MGVTEKGQAAAWQSFRTAKLVPATIQVFTGADSQARYSAVFRKTSLSGSLFVFWNDDEGTYGDRGLQDGLPVDASVLISPAPIVGEVGSWLTVSPWLGLARRSSNSVVPHPERLYAGVYAIDTAFDYVQIHGVTTEQQLARSQELAQQGYRPVALSASASWPQAGVLTASVWHRPVISEDSKEKLAKRQANAGAALLRLREAGRAWPLLRHQPDPRARSYLFARLGSREVDPRLLVRQVDMERDASIQRALLLGLGEFSEAQLPPAERDALMPRLIALYRDAPDKGVHGAAEWLLRHWQQNAKLLEIDQSMKTGKVQGQRQWYVNKQGQTLVLIPEAAEPFLMGSPRSEEGRAAGPGNPTERQHRRHIGRTFALGAKEVTVAEFQRFVQDRGRPFTYDQVRSKTDAYPINSVSWYLAAEYCNWLSEQEGLPPQEWCYEPNAQKQFAEGMKLKADYLHGAVIACRQKRNGSTPAVPGPERVISTEKVRTSWRGTRGTRTIPKTRRCCRRRKRGRMTGGCLP